MQQLGPYRIVRKLATGGMAEVFLATYRGPEGFERPVVLKRILPEYAGEEELVTMFLDEARLLATLSHPNIAQVYDLGHDGDTPYLVMEHVPGPTLRQLLDAASGDGGLPRWEALGIGLALAEALAYLHELEDELGRPLDIVHRDLNPTNVVVSRDGAVKLIDFGIAKATTKVHETRTGVIKGTEGYIAPEQRRRDAPIDHRADVFALGVVLYELCLGRHPFVVATEAGGSQGLRAPHELDADFPTPLSDLILRCLATAPDDRPASARELLEALATALAAEGVVPTLAGRAERVRRLVPPAAPGRPSQPPAATPPPPGPDDGTVQLPAARAGRASAQGGDDEDETIDRSLPPARHDDATTVARPAPVEPHAEAGSAPPSRPSEAEPADRTTRPRAAAPSAGADAPASAPGSWRAATIGPPTPRRPRRRGRRALVGAVAAALAAGMGLGAFFATRAVTDPREPSRPPTVLAADASPGDARTLRIVSEPAGAAVAVEGTIVGATPTTVHVPRDRARVWIRVSMDGYVTQERAVLATAGEARFVLDELAVDGGE